MAIIINIAVFVLIYCRIQSVIQQLDNIGFNLLVNLAVAGEGAGTFDVTGEGGDDVRVLDFLVKIAYEGAAGHMAGSDLADWLLVLLSCEGVYDCHHPVDTHNAQHLADALVVLLRRDERQQSPIRQLAVLTENGLGRLVERHNYGAAVFPNGLGRDIYIRWCRQLRPCE